MDMTKTFAGSRRSARRCCGIAKLLILFPSTVLASSSVIPSFCEAFQSKQHKTLLRPRVLSAPIECLSKEKLGLGEKTAFIHLSPALASASGGGGDEVAKESGVPTEIANSEIPNDLWEEAKEGAPSNLAVMKELLGINIFTYILAGACILFLGANVVLGPGWLGQIIGIEGTGTFTRVSDSLPGEIDLSAPENLL
mmetsp:Transcript_24623/g.49882  ORF Transcript_24623/g.49882 Transcript_24623/m.49882 type:complete len:196 (-) Transcript_24623:56-643(-)